MAIGFVSLLLINVALFVIAEILRPKPSIQGVKPGTVQMPTAQSGDPVPVVFGTCKVSCNVIWYGSPATEAVTEKVRTGLFSRQYITIGHRYIIPMAVGVCHGCVDELIDLYFGDFRLTRYGASATSPSLPADRSLGDGVVITINAPMLFGGPQFEGGVVGPMRVNWGTESQTSNAFMVDPTKQWYNAAFDPPPSPLKGICYVTFENVEMGMSPYIKPIFFVVRRCPICVTSDEDIGNINGDANPAEVVYEILTHRIWGLGLPTNLIDSSSFIEAAIALKNEETGFSTAFTTQNSGSEMIAEVLRHANMVLYEHPFTGLITIRLIRPDYDIGDLPVFDKTIISDLEFSRSVWRETYNEIKVQYVERDPDFKAEIAQSQNLASMQAINEVRSITHDYPGISNQEQAQEEAELLNRMHSVPLAKATFTSNRKAADLTIGQPFILHMPDQNIDQLVMRATQIDYGQLDSGKIQISAVEDVFDVSGVAYQPPVPPPEEDETLDDTPQPVAVQRAYELPYGISGADYEVAILARRPAGLYLGYEVWEDDGGGYVQIGDHPDFTPFARMQGIYGSYTYAVDPYGFDAFQLRDMGAIPAQGLLLLEGGEIVRYQNFIDNGNGSFRFYNIERGLIDTVPKFHAIGSRIWLLDEHFLAGPYLEDDVLSYKLLPHNNAGVLDISKATVFSITVVGRASNPYPPGNLRIQGEIYGVWPAVQLDEDLVIEWSHRNRVAQGTGLPYVLQDDPGPPYVLDGTYTLRIINVATGGIIRQAVGLTGTTYTYSAADRIADGLAPSLVVAIRLIPISAGLRTGNTNESPFFMLMTGAALTDPAGVNSSRYDTGLVQINWTNTNSFSYIQIWLNRGGPFPTNDPLSDYNVELPPGTELWQSHIAHYELLTPTYAAIRYRFGTNYTNWVFLAGSP